MNVLTALPSFAEFRLPPLDNGRWPVDQTQILLSLVADVVLHADPNRCERGFIGNTIGQANAVSDRWDAVVGMCRSAD